MSESGGEETGYRYRDDIATADVAFEAWGETLEAMFAAAAEATMNVMVSDLDTIAPVVHRRLEVAAEATEMLLFSLLQELIFFKDAEQLLLRVANIQICSETSPSDEEGREAAATDTLPPAIGRGSNRGGTLYLTADGYGEMLNPEHHDLIVDVKAVTLHRFKVERSSRGWEALVVLDV